MNRGALIVVVLGLAVALAGCAAESRTLTQPTPLATKSEDPVTAAKAAFLAYVAVSNAVSIDDQASIDAALALTAPPLHDIDSESYEDLQDAGWGVERKLKVTMLESRSPTTDISTIVLDACLDGTATRFINSAGERGTRPNQAGVEGRTIEVSNIDGTWLVSKLSPRDGAPQC